MRKRSVKNNKKYDENVLNSLKSLPVSFKTFDNHEVIFGKGKRYETIFEHISKQKHKFKTSDIKTIPKILNSKKSLQKDNKKNIFRNYIGDRPKKNTRLKYIKIVTLKVSDNKEVIVTIYLVKNKYVAKKNKNR